MRLKAFTVDGYRAFADPTQVELRPLTLLFGYNNAGKSALLRALPLLASSVDSALSGPLALQSEAARDASFSDMLCQLTGRSTIRFALTWDAMPNGIKSLEFTLRDVNSARRQIVERIIASGSFGDLKLEWSPGERTSETWQRYQLSLGAQESIRNDLAFEGLLPTLIDERFGSSDLVEALRDVQTALRSLRSSVHWLGPLRKVPARRLEYKGPPDRLQPDGTGAAEVLAHDLLGDGALMDLVKEWYREAVGYRLELMRDSRLDSELISVVVGPLDTPTVRVPILDTGEGMGQVLPILVLLAMARLGRLGTDPVIAVEHPELHLQPTAHAELAGVFCDLAQTDSAPVMLVETHSENFLLRVQHEIVHGNLSPDKVLVYWVRQEEDGRATANPVEFDELARPLSNWPPGVFKKAPEQAGQIAIERRRRRPT
jgi:predicted ATPase